MFIHYRLISSCLLVLFLCGVLTAQNEKSAPQRTTPIVTIAVGGEQVRITAPSSITEIQLIVYSEAGEKLFESSQNGNLLDYAVQDRSGTRLITGNYLCVVQVKSLSGKLSQKLGQLLVQDKQLTVQPLETSQLNIAQTQIADGEATPLTALGNNQAEAAAVIAHDGTDGQMIRSRGALSFRLGDFFRARDKEQMRLSETGDLDVAGTIRAKRFLVVKPDSADKNRTKTAADSVESVQPLVWGTGTTGNLTKWMDETGGLADSIMTETANMVGIGTNSPNSLLELKAASPILTFNADTNDSYRGLNWMGAGYGPNVLGSMLMNGHTGDLQIKAGYVGYGGFVSLHTNGVERMRATANGNIGIGTESPNSLLELNSTTPILSFNASNRDSYQGVNWLANGYGPNPLGSILMNGQSGELQMKSGYPGWGGFFTFHTNGLERMRLDQNGKLTVNGLIESTAGGVKFPDGTIQTTAGGGSLFTILNQFTQQTSANFNIDGTGKANAFDAAQYRIGGKTVLSVLEFERNAFVGITTPTMAGVQNSIFGVRAGTVTSASQNSFFGSDAGWMNKSGEYNSYFGFGSGALNETGVLNAFFGASAGWRARSGSYNSVFGARAGDNPIGNYNTLVGASTNVAGEYLSNATAIGYRAMVAQSNSLVLGSINGVNGATADTKVGIGTGTPTSPLTVNGIVESKSGGFKFPDGTVQTTAGGGGSGGGIANQTTLQTGANFNIDGTGTANTFYATGGFKFPDGTIQTTAGGGGSGGSIANQTTLQTGANFNIGGTGKADILEAATQYNLGGFRILSASSGNTLVGIISPGSGIWNTIVGSAPSRSHIGSQNSIFGASIGPVYITGPDNSFFGFNAGNNNLFSGSGDTLIGSAAQTASGDLNNATAIGFRAYVAQNNSLVLGSINGVNGATASVNVGIGTTTPADRLDVNGDIRVGDTDTNGCLKNNNGGTIVGTCSSDARFKRNLQPFSPVLNRVTQLQPYYFFWRTAEFPDKRFGNEREVGLVAQQVEQVMPELVTMDKDGYKMVDYSKLPLLTLQALKELKAENAALKARLNRLERSVNGRRRHK